MTTILNWALIVGTVALVISGIKFYNKSKTARTYTGLLTELNRLQSAQGVFASLMNETIEYSKTHPAINPVLEQIGAKPAPGAAAPAIPKPVAK